MPELVYLSVPPRGSPGVHLLLEMASIFRVLALVAWLVPYQGGVATWPGLLQTGFEQTYKQVGWQAGKYRESQK